VITAALRVRSLAALVDAAENAPRDALERAAFIAKGVLVARLRAKVGGEQRLSGTASNAKVGVNYQLARTGAAQAVVKATGPWQLFNNPAAAHLILAQALGTRSTASGAQARLGARVAFGGSGRGMFRESQRTFVGSKRAISEGRARLAKQALSTPSGLRAYAFHPGHAGSRTWEQGLAAAKQPVAEALVDTAVTAMKRAMK
jgi:hypothetical protein